MNIMLEPLDFLVITLIFLGTTGLFLAAYYLDQRAWKVVMESWKKEMEIELRELLSDFKNTGTGLKSSLTRILGSGSKDVADQSVTEIAIRELLQSDAVKQLINKGASRFGVSGPGIPQPEVPNTPPEDEQQKILKEVLNKKEYKFLEEIQQKIREKTK